MSGVGVDQLNAALEGRYRVERELGEGGMATVYLAEDLKHHRNVALKVLKPELAAMVGPERFLAEIETTAKLQHPHILPLFDSGQAGSQPFYVMPYVEGESLRQKLERERQVPVEEAVAMVRSVGLALQYAHDHGVVHRDIKPANVLLQAGQPLVADFGIALAVRAAGGARITETGLSLGTPHYMSPEQASGDREVDHRSDIYSLGCVLYEMLVGDPPHTGATLQSVLAKLLSEEPRPVTLFRKTVPPNVEAAVMKALARVPADRFRSAAELVAALDDPSFRLERPTPAAGAATRPSPARRWAPWGVAAMATVAALFGWLGATPDRPVSRFSISLSQTEPMTGEVGSALALSPDGSRLVYVGIGPAGNQLFMRERGALSAQPLSGTIGAGEAFFSPDGTWVGFTAESRIRKVAVGGGPPVDLGDAGAFRGGAWTDRGEIIYCPTTGAGLWSIPAEGGTPVQLTVPRVELGESSHRWPDPLPGGRAVLLTIFNGNLSEGSVAAYDLENDEIKILVPGGFYGRWVPSGHLAYLTEGGRLLVQPFDPRRLELTGGAVAVAEGLALNAGSAGADFAVARNGTLVYRRSAAWDAVVRVDPDGTETVLIDSLGGMAESLRFSPDGRSIVFGLATEIWTYDLDGGSPVRRTFDGTNRYPDWSPDGRRLSFASRRPGSRGLDLMTRPSDGSGQAEMLWEADHEQYEHAWTRTGDLVVRQTVPETGRDIWLVPADGGDPEPLVRTRFNERAIALSPDQRWLAYVSNESGTAQVYVRPFPGPDGKWLISVAGGEEPAWSPDGRELYYRAGRKVMAARLEMGSTVRVRDRRVLFDDVYGGNTDHTDYDVHPTEGWFVFTRQLGPPPELIWTDNWFTELREQFR